MLPSLQAVVGNDNVVEPPLQMFADDVSLYSQQAPAMYFFVGATASSNHSPKFALDESALDLGLRALLQVTLDYLHGDDAG